MNRTLIKRASAGLALSLGLLTAACGGTPEWRGLESAKQPVVTRTNYTMDLASSPSGLSIPEQRRLADWFAAMELGYGDRIAIDDPNASQATRDAIQAIASRYGMIVQDTAPVTQGVIAPGSARVVVTRSRAEVPGCPDWSAQSDLNDVNATYPNYGCAVNGNLAAMVADPEDLLRGQQSEGGSSVATSDKAIDSYRKAAPTGEQGLQDTSAGGGD
ncbi:CpaD family pilus assembly protein [Pseudoblastomonas halimionae]|uniref:Pilus assembly protein CpaD n=1 Tax=Alteriqipengyuania halimionae TaxID=1926630 RepID=A0A6I4U5K8_9SPHN|nr:CpaD family pilus assembly protein [Alteriqipengyuania halimionae]MXP10185.1 pilus assembly protein CpaD [Alteriqipengyuania halimionae]